GPGGGARRGLHTTDGSFTLSVWSGYIERIRAEGARGPLRRGRRRGEAPRLHRRPAARTAPRAPVPVPAGRVVVSAAGGHIVCTAWLTTSGACAGSFRRWGTGG